jgi:hypothetical protein
MKHFVWVSFDLGVKGDYQGMYAWLDGKDAKECGDSLACFWFEHKNNDLLEDLKKDLRASVELDENKGRVYVVRLMKGKMKGRFIIGRRRNPPWAGFGATGDDSEDSSNE